MPEPPVHRRPAAEATPADARPPDTTAEAAAEATVKDPIADPAATHLDPTGTAPPRPRPPGVRAVVPGYEILRELGRGGMGVVYLARQTKLNRTVALKMILAGGHAGPEELRRFLAEAEAVAQLQHPNIVQIFESGEHEGLPYFSLEYVGGGTLAQQVREQPLLPNAAARVVKQLARGVAYANGRGVVHRDLKPENVLLATEDTENTESKAERQSQAEGSGRKPRAPAANLSSASLSVSLRLNSPPKSPTSAWPSASRWTATTTPAARTPAPWSAPRVTWLPSRPAATCGRSGRSPTSMRWAPSSTES